MKHVTTLAQIAFLFCSVANTAVLPSPHHIGNGCPPGVLIDEDHAQGTVALTLPAMEVKAGSSLGKHFSKRCLLSIPMSRPQKSKFALIGYRYHGYNRLPYGTKARIRLKAYLNQLDPYVESRTFHGYAKSTFNYNAFQAKDALLWSSCAHHTFLKLDVEISSHSNWRRAQTLTKLGTEEKPAGILFYIAEEPCDE